MFLLPEAVFIVHGSIKPGEATGWLSPRWMKTAEKTSLAKSPENIDTGIMSAAIFLQRLFMFLL